MPALEGGRNSSLSPIPPLPWESRVEREILIQQGIYEEGKKSEASSQFDDLLVLKVASPSITKTELFYKPDCWIWRLLVKHKKAEKIPQRSFLLPHSIMAFIQSQKKQNKPLRLCLWRIQIQLCWYSITKEHQGSKKNGGEVKRFTAGCLLPIPWPTN